MRLECTTIGLIRHVLLFVAEKDSGDAVRSHKQTEGAIARSLERVRQARRLSVDARPGINSENSWQQMDRGREVFFGAKGQQ